MSPHLVDLILLTAPLEDPWRVRSTEGIEAAAKNLTGTSVRLPGEDALLRLRDAGVLQVQKNEMGFLFVGVTRDGARAHFTRRYRVPETLERERPFPGGILDALGRWFDEYFSPKSKMIQRLSESGIPGATLGDGTKWKEAASLFSTWNCSGRFTYFSALFVFLLDREQWVTEQEQRSKAWDALSAIFRAADLRIEEPGYLVPIGITPPLACDGSFPKDEARFRTEVVEPLLRRLRLVRNVLHTHGNDEFGRDFVFEYEHPLPNRSRWVAVQVKMGDLPATAGGELRTIVDQVMMSFEHPLIVLPNMKSVSTSEVIVVVSGRVTGPAKQRVLEAISDPVWRANVAFLDGDAIREMQRQMARSTMPGPV